MLTIFLVSGLTAKVTFCG
uniref:Uncharacterized protein n=1 Tax=Arundo donax TaxID=35708 RepID=A0A0A9AXZ8_ARUDO